ncbi:MAG: universal stress protein [Chloroflexota bacterium]
MKKCRVLIPMDGQDFRQKIVPVVRQLFDPQDAELVLLRVAPLSSVPGTMHYYYDMGLGDMAFVPYMEAGENSTDIKAAYRADLVAELQKDAIPLRTAGYNVQVAARLGDPVEQIVHYTNTVNVDLIAMATRCHTGIRRLFQRSISQEVLQQVSTPVMMLRPLTQQAGQPVVGDSLTQPVPA